MSDSHVDEVKRTTIEDIEITQTGSNGSRNFLRDLPYDSSKWFNTVAEQARERADGQDFADSEPIARAWVDRVHRVDPETSEFDVSYEGRWTMLAPDSDRGTDD